MVKKGDFLEREGRVYEVVVCDDDIFVIGEVSYDATECRRSTSYENLEAYSNNNTVNTLADLKFTIMI